MGMSIARCNWELHKAEEGLLSKVASLVGHHGSLGVTAEEGGHLDPWCSEMSDSGIVLLPGCA